MTVTNTVIAQYLEKRTGDAPPNGLDHNYTTPGIYCKLLEDGLSIDRDLADFYNVAWNINTAVGIWLDYWGVWVGVSRNVIVPNTHIFGFDGSGGANFDNAPFVSPNNSGGVIYPLMDYVYRRLILLKSFANISDCSVITLNKILTQFFINRGRCYVIDNLDMTMRINFEFELMPWEKAIIENYDVFPRPAGVKITTSFISPSMFGFDGSGLSNFDNGYFGQGL